MSYISEIIKNIKYRIFTEPLTISPIWLDLGGSIKVKIDSKVSLELFNEIFVLQQYEDIGENLPNINFIVDLGANRGFFILYSLFLMQKKGLGNDLTFLCVEPDKKNIEALKEHIKDLPVEVEVVQGVVCEKRKGTVPFYSINRLHVIGKVLDERRWTTKEVRVVDLAQVVGQREIDLLKIDIEGSEQGFLSEYSDILKITKIIVIEFHTKRVDYSICRSILENNGFRLKRKIFTFTDDLFVEMYFRSGDINKW